MEKLKRGIFLDRDGVINKCVKGTPGTDADYYILGWDQFEFLPGVLDAMFELYCMDYEVFVISNQSGISKDLGYGGWSVSSATIETIFSRMFTAITDDVTGRILLNQGIPDFPELSLPTPRHKMDGCFMSPLANLPDTSPRVIREYMFCPHLPEHNCACRKPKPGMIYSLAVKWGIDLQKSWMIGDQDSDLDAGYNAGIHYRIKIVDVAAEYTDANIITSIKQRGYGVTNTHEIRSSLLNAVEFIRDVDRKVEEDGI